MIGAGSMPQAKAGRNGLPELVPHIAQQCREGNKALPWHRSLEAVGSRSCEAKLRKAVRQGAKQDRAHPLRWTPEAAGLWSRGARPVGACGIAIGNKIIVFGP